MKHLGIDLGTSNTLIYQRGKGIVLREPSVVAVESRTNAVVAVGDEARLMLGKTPGSIKALRPLKDGVIAEFDATAEMLHRYFRKVSGNTIFTRPRVVVCVPYGVTEVEKRAVQDVTLEAGAQSVALIEEPLAAASGAGLRIDDARGSMIVDIGGGTTEVAVIALGGIVLSSSLRIGGDELDEAIVQYVKQKYNVLIGEMTAEALKRKIGAVFPDAEGGVMEIRGRNLSNGLPAILNVTSHDVREAMHFQLVNIIDTIRSTLENTPPELAADIFDGGIALTGGGAMLKGIDTLIQQVTGIRAITIKNPMDAVVLGIGRMMETPNIDGVVRFKGK